MQRRATRVLICYPLVNPYIAACWRALHRRQGLDVFVIGQRSGEGDLVDFGAGIMGGLNARLLVGAERRDPRIVARLAQEFAPDVMIVSGWSEPAFRPLYFNRRLAPARKILLMDNQFRRSWRQAVGRIALQPLLRRVSRLFVVGERSWQYARVLGFPESRIDRGAIGIDYAGLRPLLAERIAAGPWPRSFLFAGRYHERKALDVLVEAYAAYRLQRPDPFALRAAGKGPQGDRLKGTPGAVDMGFLNPDQMRLAWRDAGCFVIPSRYDAWPLALVEAAASGLPVIASEECGSAVENVRHLFNGYLVPTGDAASLTRAMLWVHDRYEDLPEIGARGQPFAAAYDAEIWADRAQASIEAALA